MNTSPGIRGGLSRVTARVVGSRFAKPIARVALVVTSVVVLALIGHAASPHTALAPASTATPSTPSVEAPAPIAPAAPMTAAAPASHPPEASTPSHGPASPEDPVVLNTATAEEFRRLPGIGDKRANAMLALRARLGRFHAIEDLLKVKGIGRATLKRLRPLVRLDPRPSADGADAAPGT